MLNAKSFGLAGGILWALGLIILTIIGMNGSYAPSFFSFMAEVYPGYALTGSGLVFGAIWAFVDAFIGLYLFAWLYNWLCKKCGKK